MEIGQAATFPCDATLVQGGFYPPERSAEGISFRWIGPMPQATIFLPKPAEPAPLVSVALSVHSAFIPDVLEGVRLALDGGPWVTAVLCRDSLGTRLTACLRPGPLPHVGAHRLDIDSLRTQSPRERGETDDRRLSIALSSVSITAKPA